MIPLKDHIPTRRTPIVNYGLIALSILVYGFQMLSGPQADSLVYKFALIPFQLTHSLSLSAITNLFTSMFMHAGLAHLGGNMLYLWIFGDNVEDRMGRGRYLLFYLLGGIVASTTHAYLVLYPQSRVLTIIPLGIFIRITTIPASIVLGLWFVIQFFSGVLSLGGPDVGGVAFWAHIGGFVVGVVFAKKIAKPKEPEYLRHW